MKTTHLLITCLFVVAGLISCSSNDEEQQESIPGTGTLQTASGLTPVDTGSTVKQANVAGALALNPQHGAPGHRCDINVGAPLNSAPVNKTTIPSIQPLMQRTPPGQATTNNNPVNPVTPPAANTAPVTAGINPAHGAPGHRCDIAVGAPLNSAPANTTPAQAPIQMSAPVQPKTNNINNSTAKINPAHGQPGHDCAVPVGQPLKQ